MKRIAKREDESAVSPVVGVMLMLVVTIIIAAVVSAFAGGMGSTQTKTPQASIAVKTGTTSGNLEITFEHLGGDPVLTKDCQFITYLTWPNGTIVRPVQTPSSPLARSEVGLAPVGYTYSRVPHLADPQKYAYPCNPQNNVTLGSGWTVNGYMDVGDNPAWFGKAVWLPGDVARTFNNGFTANFVGLVADPMNPTADNMTALREAVQKNCRLDIKLLHVPSGKYIMDKTITLQG